MITEGLIGPQVLGDGTIDIVRTGKTGDPIFSGFNGRYYEQAIRGNVYSFASQAAMTTQAVATTAAITTITLSNNMNSGKNLVILQVSWAFSTTPAAITCVSLCGNLSTTNVTHTTAGIIQNGFLGTGVASVAKVDTTATVPVAPIVVFPIVSGGTSAIGPYMSVIDVGGSLVLPPGSYVTIAANAAAIGFGGIVWEEVNI